MESVRPDQESTFNGTGYAVVIFCDQKDLRDCVAYWDSFCNRLLYAFYSKIGCCRPSTPPFQGQTLRVERAPDASDILWENLGVPASERRCAPLKGFMYIFFLLAAGAGIIIGLTAVQEDVILKVQEGGCEDRDPGQMGLSLLPVLGIVIVNLLLHIFGKRMAKSEMHATLTMQDASFMVKLSIAQLLNTVGAIVFYKNHSRTWFVTCG